MRSAAVDRRTARAAAALCLFALLFAGCATSSGPDPWEHANRKIFAFNEGVDRYALGPAAHAWNFVVPSPVERAIRRAFDNMSMPRVFLNDLLQGYPLRAGQDVVRFVLNSTFGYAGIFDVATDAGIPKSDADFGQTLGVWGVKSGPYLVLPLLGPSDVRDGVGYAVDAVAVPWGWLLPAWTGSLILVRIVNLRAIYNDEIEENRRTAIDYYLFMRSAFLQNRRRSVERRRHGLRAPPQPPADIYDVDGGDDAQP